MDIASSRPEALSLGYRLYYGNECNHCGTSVKRVKKYDCLACHKKNREEIFSRLKDSPQVKASRKSFKRLRKAGVDLAYVPWADRKKIAEIYAQGRLRGLHVDHIVPLKHPLVCGLHCEFNLQLLAPEVNIAKRNHFEIL